MKPFRVVVRVKNNRMVRLREELGMNGTEFARAAGVQMNHYNALENLRIPAFIESRGVWTKTARRVADFHGVSCEWLWPDEVQAIRAKALALEANTRELTGLPTQALLEAKELHEVLGQAKNALTPRERQIVERHLEADDPKGLKEIGEEQALSRERVRQIESSAMRKLRHMATHRGQMPPEIKERLSIDHEEIKCKHLGEVTRTRSEIHGGQIKVVCESCRSAWYEDEPKSVH